MSLVNLAHVCSHLQNAAKARLGVTSIPATKLHARLMIELQKQGFLHSVVLGGPSPPLPYKLRTPPEHSLEETQRDYIQLNPWAAFPEPDRQTAFRLTSFHDVASLASKNADSTSTELPDEPDNRPGVAQELRTEFKEDIPEDYFEEEELDEEEDIARTPSETPVLGQRISISSIAASLSRPATVQSALTRPRPELLKPIRKTARKTFDINHNVPEDDLVPTNPAQRRLWLGLKYWNSEPVLSRMSMVSKPTKRIWLNHRDLGLIVRGRSTKQVKGIMNPGECLFVTTDRGIMEARECFEKRIGGTVLCRAS